MLFDKQSIDDAVSPVVGVILMVAVTVILAAVIGSFVLDLGNNVQANPQAGVTFDQSQQDTNDDNNDLETVVSVQVISMENADEVIVSDGYASTSDQSMTSVGSSVTMTGPEDTNDADANGNPDDNPGLQDGDKITVVGTLDGKEAVLQSYTVDA